MANKDEKALITKIDSITDISQSQQDRLNIQDSAHTVLCAFLQSHIMKVTSKNTLKSALEQKFTDALNSKDEPLPLVAAIKIYEILSKAETDSDTAVLGLFKSNPNIFLNVTENKLDEENSKAQLSEEDLNNAKELLALLGRGGKLAKSEFPEKGE